MHLVSTITIATITFPLLVTPLINRHAVVTRHNPTLGLPIYPDTLSSLGNGAFSFNIDITGLQSLNSSYQPFDLNTLADWAWHTSFEGVDALRAYNYTSYNTSVSYGSVRSVRYPTGYNSTSSSGSWLHNNPHKIVLGQVSLAWLTTSIINAKPIESNDIMNATQTLDSWTGSAISSSTLQSPKQLNKGESSLTNALVFTTVHPSVDALAVRVELSSQSSLNPVPLALRIAFPYTNGGAADWVHDSNHTTVIVVNGPGRVGIQRSLDSDGYRVDCSFNESWTLTHDINTPHILVFSPPSTDSTASTDLVCLFAPRDIAYPIGSTSPWLLDKRSQTVALQENGVALSYDDVAAASAIMWADYWNQGAFVDLSGASGGAIADAFELERRVIRSLYLLRALEAGAEPPAETGLLLAGNWVGKHHGEMRYWHQGWAAFWNRSDFLSRSDLFYADYLLNATSVAASQGYKGARWPKMTAVVSNRSAGGADVPWIGLEYAPLPSSVNGGDVDTLSPLLLWESSSGVGPLLVWQQSHSILMAEAQRRQAAAFGGATAALAIMNRLAPIVYATADFLASFVVADSNGTYHLLPPLYGGEESGNPLVISDPAFELVQFNNALDTAAAWRQALGLPPVDTWEAVRGNLAPPPLDPATSSPQLYANNAACACLYLPKSSSCSFPREGCPSPLVSHPMTSGLHGMLNGLAGDDGFRYKVNVTSLNATAAAILTNWNWGSPSSSPSVWGWDAPLLSLSLSRLGWTPESTIAALMLNFNKNLYNRQGINQGMGDLTAYFPGNGGTLLAVSAMASGFDGGNPGDQLRKQGPGAIASDPISPIGFPSSWGAVTEGFNIPLP